MALTEEQAKHIAIKETDYCYVLAIAWESNPNDSICLERIFTKGGCEEIRMAWWKDGKLTTRPPDIDVDAWVNLFSKALSLKVFNDSEQLGMIKALLKQGI
ncbi:MAG: hypothetical protein NT106_13545 [Candidatus Sumerlaeota bacterium]|nr:hypothetical protein [Candidatus Sumerlaeota bacterium]